MISLDTLFTGEQIINSLPFPAYTCDKSGYITQYNAQAVELWGRTPEPGNELWCGSWKMYHSNGDAADPDEYPMAVALREGRAVYGHEIIIERPDGSRSNVLPYPKPFKDKYGNVTGAINILIDVTEKKLEEKSAAQFEAIVESSEDAIVSKTLEGIVTSWNASAERIFGFTAEEMIGQPLWKIIPDDRKREEPEILSRLRRGERVEHFETKRQTKEGKLIDISLTISPMRNRKGEIVGVSKVARNITNQKETERLVRESEERFRMAVISTGLGTWEYVPATGYLDWSKECREIYGLPEDHKIDFDFFSKSIHPEDTENTLSAIQRALEPAGDGKYDVRFRILRYGTNEVRWIRSQGKVFFDEQHQPTRFIGTVLDMTDQIRNNAALEQQIKQRTEELQKLNQRLLTSNRELEQFAYVASHDLQEPLRKINAFGDMLTSKLGDAVNSDGLDLIRRMQSASTRMKSLIDGLLSYSLISSTTTKPEIIELSRTIAEVYEDVETSLKAKEGKIVTGELFPVIGDPLQLKQLFQNLVSNSLKFSKEGEAPVIQVSARLVKGSESGFNINEDDQDKQFQLIEVKDNGIGFEQEYANKIFQLFERLHGKGEYPGNGMGLSIVQKVVENHHGYIRAESQLREGTTFQILLPATS